MPNVVRDNLSDILWIAAVAVVALGAALALRRYVNRTSERMPDLPVILQRTRYALITLVVVAAIRLALIGIETSDGRWAQVVEHILTIAMIAAVTWFACAVVIAVEGVILSRIAGTYAEDGVRMCKARTQIMLFRRLVIAIFILVGIAAILMTFPAIRIVGQGLLASAGLISIVAGLAAQTALTNVFAGIQLALTDAIRIGDVVSVENQSGTVGEITLTYVVIYLWDDRRLILPSSYFVTTPFENWTRRGDRINSVVLIEVDWTVPLDALREEYTRALADTPHWDGRTSSMVVSDVAGGNVMLRFTSSAATTDDMFGLSACVREMVVRFLAEQGEAGIPRRRQQQVDPDGTPSGEATDMTRPASHRT